MPSATIRVMLCLSLALAVTAIAGPPLAPAGKGPRLTGPFTKGNLTIFLVHGADQVPGRTYLTLREAFEQKTVVVHETTQVNKLSIENRSTTHTVFVQSGEIVKGGKQDRVLARDMLLPPNSGPVPLPSHCVERGRWQQRGAESAGAFSASEDYVAGKELKIANAILADQDFVWENVRSVQQKITTNLKSDVQRTTSPTSLQLSLEHPKLKPAIDAHVRILMPIIDSKPDVVGFIFAINGKLNNGEVYGSSALFRKLWPKLLKASAVEAVAEELSGAKIIEPMLATATAFLKEADRAALAEPRTKSMVATPSQYRAGQQQVTTGAPNAAPPAHPKGPDRLQVLQGETSKVRVVESRDRAHREDWIHRSYFAK